jgi:hypothetical protein
MFAVCRRQTTSKQATHSADNHTLPSDNSRMRIHALHAILYAVDNEHVFRHSVAIASQLFHASANSYSAKDGVPLVDTETELKLHFYRIFVLPSQEVAYYALL